MNTANAIAQAIAAKIANTTLSSWRIGLTHDHVERKRYWGLSAGHNTSRWTAWQAACLEDAQRIEAFFIDKGMKGGTGGDLSPNRPVFVYVF